jgi:predicted O-methyltransferase YrrM
MQKQSEILHLVQILKALGPLTICEIGAARCGTTFLLAHAATKDATIITVDLDFTVSRMAAVKHFAANGQQLICLRRDSHSLETLDAVKACLQGRSFDVLYIDGDHSYEGIKTDFKLYSSLVRPEGIIVFHDIVPDYKARYGIATNHCAGGVPRFWEEIKAAHTNVEEIVEDYGQDGFGIGLLHWRGDTAVSPCDVRGVSAGLN